MVRALCSHRRGRGFEPLYLYHRFERRLEAIQKMGVWHKCRSLFFLFRPLPRSPLRGDIVKRNRDARQASLFRRCAPYEPLYLYHRFEQRLEAIQKNREFGTNAAPCFLFRSLPRSPLRADIRKRNCDARQASLFRRCAPYGCPRSGSFREVATIL